MDAIANPFMPGAGAPPPELAGRDGLIDQARILVGRARRGMAAQGLLMIGLRGVGKTVLLDHMCNAAEADGICVVRAEAADGRSLPSLLVPELHRTLVSLSRHAATKELAQRASRVMAGFVRGLRLKYGDIEVGITAAPERGVADHGDLEQDLSAVLDAVGASVGKAHSALILFLDEHELSPAKPLARL